MSVTAMSGINSELQNVTDMTDICPTLGIIYMCMNIYQISAKQTLKHLNLSIGSSDDFSKIAFCSWKKGREWAAGILEAKYKYKCKYKYQFTK